MNNHRIYLYVDPLTRAVELDFPKPNGGIPKVEPPTATTKATIRFDAMTLEQRAYYVFWDNGTRERFDALVHDGLEGAGLRHALRWLFHMRAQEVKTKTGFEYKVEIISDADRWQKREK